MKYVAEIGFTRNQLKELHAWLDTFAGDWRYFNTISKTPSDYDRQEKVRTANEEFCELCMGRGTGGHTSTIQVLIQHRRGAMAARLAWSTCTIYSLDEDGNLSPGDRHLDR